MRIITTEELRKLRIFLTGYAPLLALISAQAGIGWYTGSRISSVVCVVAALLSALGFLDGWRLPKGSLRKGSTRRIVKDDKNPPRTQQVGYYLAGYLIILIGYMWETWQEAYSLLVMLVLLGVCWEYGSKVINPVLRLWGWRMAYHRLGTWAGGDTSDRDRVILLHKRGDGLEEGDVINVVRFGHMFIVKE